jgi:hypothetical protein
MLLTKWVNFKSMKTDEVISHITDDMGNDVVTPLQLDAEYDVLCAVAEAADEDHRAHCLLLTNNCPLCKALAELDFVRRGQRKLDRN